MFTSFLHKCLNHFTEKKISNEYDQNTLYDILKRISKLLLKSYFIM